MSKQKAHATTPPKSSARRSLHPQRDSFLLPVAPAAAEESLGEVGERVPEEPQAARVQEALEQEAPREVELEAPREVARAADRGVEEPRAQADFRDRRSKE